MNGEVSRSICSENEYLFTHLVPIWRFGHEGR